MEEQRADASESADDPLGRLAKRLLDSSLDDVDLEEPSAPAVEGGVSPLPPPLLRLRDYAVVSRLGRGGMGAVYLAHQRSLPDKQVALKVLPGLYATDPERLARFRNEAVTASRLNHPNVVAVLDVGYENDVHFQVQELVEDGRTLGHLIGEARDARTLPKDWYRTTAELFAKIAEALAAVHAASVLHRDIKPSNILLTPMGEPKVGDFGLAKDLEGMSGMTRGGSPGTLNYKSPEQLDKSFGKVDQRSDVFSLGVTMYEALTLARLFPGDEPSEVQPAILGREIEDLRQVRPGVPKDLSTVCRKCLEKRPEKRYQTMAEVAADLRRYLRNEPILAKEPSRWERVWKWSRRNPGVATGIGVGTVALVVISVVALLAVQLAGEKAAKVKDFNQLAGVERLKAVLAKQEQLWPAWPDKVDALKKWLSEDCGKLLEMEPEIRRTVEDLRSRALPQTTEQAEEDRRTHTRYAEFELLTKQVESLRHAQAIRARQQQLVVPELSPEQQALDPNALKALAWSRVAPKPEDRAVWGEEALGLAAARAAVAKAGPRDGVYIFLGTLAWALLANGQDDDAKKVSAEALAHAPDNRRAEYAGYHRGLNVAIEQAEAVWRSREAALAALATLVGERHTWLFPDTDDGDAAHFLQEILSELLGKLASVASRQKVDVEQRLDWAQQVRGATLGHPKAGATWAAARTAIAKADGYVASKLYSGVSIPLPDEAVTGLVPIGMNPVTKLWEFYELRSAWDGRQAATDIDIPRHKEDGSIEVRDGTGIVFVLLPGGTVTLGSQKNDPKAPFYDPQSRDNEALHEVVLSPFFLARHELTQGQWARMWSWDEELRYPSGYRAGQNAAGQWITLANPVERVDWPMCERLLLRHGLVLPTEAQWEYGCRAGTESVWNVDFEQLRTVANVADEAAKAAIPSWGEFESWCDEYVVHSPVSTFSANEFGLYDVHGNVGEWCRDWYRDDGSYRVGDGLQSAGAAAIRANRGGSYNDEAVGSRSALRCADVSTLRVGNLGLRPARLVTF